MATNIDLSVFKSKNLFEAGNDFFQQLGIHLNSNTTSKLNLKKVLSAYYKDLPAFKEVVDTYYLGIINNNLFSEDKFGEKYSIEQINNIIKEGYDGIIIFAVDYRKYMPSRSDLASLTRAFNMASKNIPVVLLAKYRSENNIFVSFNLAERTKYLRSHLSGEKIGKVTLLKDINVENTHRGHISILSDLAVKLEGRDAITNFTQLYYYWQSVFSISVLNKNFYQEIIKWFNNAIVEIKIPSQEPASEKHKDFTVRLIARLIFVWFLKELKVVRDELLVPSFYNGNINNLIIPIAGKSAYYKFILQNLFFNALNREDNERSKNDFDVYSSYFSNPSRLKEYIFKSPYLNGGLFDIHENDWCSKGKVNNAFEVPDNLFLDLELGLNSILSKFKFTIAENTPQEEEIAVDPEMLGRIFENLLAEQNDDTKEAARKDVGAFYTPRSVVSYMCRNTLLHHLNIAISPENGKEIVKKLLNTTVLDPACGSGAYPMGMLEEMMQILDKVDPEGNLWTSEMLKSNDEDFVKYIADFIADKQYKYVKKLGLLRNCLFGIDILDYAVEITKLRCWLSLIVEQKVDFSKKNFNLKPLPNLEFKFYRKNSLFRYYKDKNLNAFILDVDNENLLGDLVDLENEYFIAKSSKHGTKEEIKNKIILLLEKFVEQKENNVNDSIKHFIRLLNQTISRGDSMSLINKLKKKIKNLHTELAELGSLRNNIKGYFIERVVFPGIFGHNIDSSGFDIVIGNPPYVNTKLINKLGISEKLIEEYGYCDDLYNHFTIRGLELLKKGGILSFITSDTFLTLQTKLNMRKQFLGLSDSLNGDLFAEDISIIPECSVIEIINTPKAFSALVDTAIFTLKKEKKNDESKLIYIDLRKPNAVTFEISNYEWELIKKSKDNRSGWERILEYSFHSLSVKESNWVISHYCNNSMISKDISSTLLKFKLSYKPYIDIPNYPIFSPTKYNCNIYEKIVYPSKNININWWERIETSREIERNRVDIQKYIKTIKENDISLIGILTDGGVGLQTGDNGRFVGYKENSRYGISCKEKRAGKLYKAMKEKPDIKLKWKVLKNINSENDLMVLLNSMAEEKIWQLFDEIKNEYNLRIFGKGFMYRVIPKKLEYDTSSITEKQKKEGINSNKCWVPYDKGDREGNRWYLETPYLIDWSISSVKVLSNDERARWQGYNFFFRNGFCWTNVLNPNSSYFKCRLKDITVNDVGSMSLYDESNLKDSYFVLSLNSYLHFKILREFINGSVNVQLNDIRKLPIKIPSKKQLEKFDQLFNQCLNIKKQYFSNEIDKTDSKRLLLPIEDEIDEEINRFYGIDAVDEFKSNSDDDFLETDEIDAESEDEDE